MNTKFRSRMDLSEGIEGCLDMFRAGMVIIV